LDSPGESFRSDANETPATPEIEAELEQLKRRIAPEKPADTEA